MTDRLRYGLFATILGVTGLALSVLGFLAARSPAVARLVGASDGIASLVTGLSFTAIACGVVLHYGRRSAQLTTAYQDLHRATLQRERSEAALRESERFTRATLDAMDAQIAVLDADGVVMAVNRAWRTQPHPLLCEAGECDVGSNYLSLCDGFTNGLAAEAARVAAAIRAISSGERDDCLLESHVHVGGRLVVTRVTRFAGKGPLRLVVAHQDVTALAHAPQLVAPEVPTDRVADQSPIGLFRADAFGEVTYANAQLLGLAGMDLADALGTGWLRMVHPDDRDATVAQWQRLVDGRSSGEATFRVVGPDGATLACTLLVHAVDGDAPAFVGAVVEATSTDAAVEHDRPDSALAVELVGRLDDLTRERDRIRTAFRGAESERARMAGELAHLYDDAPCGYHALDADGVIVAINETACGWLGYRRTELVGESRFAELLSPASAARLADTLRHLEDQGGVQHVELDVVRKDKSLLVLSARLSAVRDADGRPAGSRATLVDVTELRAAGARIEPLERVAAERAAELDDAHRQLAEAHGRLEGMTCRLDELSRQLAEATRELESRPDVPADTGPPQRLGIVPERPSGRTAPGSAPVDMTALARDVVDEVRRSHPARDVLVTIDGLAPAHGDPMLLRQLLVHLVDNAFKYTAEVAHPYLDLGSVDGEGGPVYYVRDNGAGFDPRRAGKLFVFEGLDPSNGSDGAMGLALVQRVVEQHGGRVWAEGRIDDGATFFFTLG